MGVYRIGIIMQARIDKIISNVRQHIQERDFHSANTELDKLARITVEITTSNKFLVSSSDGHRKANEQIKAREEAVHSEITESVLHMEKLLKLIDEHESRQNGIS
jgi:hypothetical protein